MAAALNPYGILGWNVGGTTSTAVAGASEGQVLNRLAWPSEAHRGPEAMIEDFCSRARKLVDARAGFERLGVSIGGPMNPIAGVIHAPPHLPGWDDVPLAEILHRRLGLPVVVEHDAAACLLAETYWGQTKGCSHAIYLTCGTGCGAGVLIDGRILRGPNGQSPEVGHVRLAPDGPEVFGKRGCVESFCSGEGIGKLAPLLFPDRFVEPVDPEQLSRATASGDREARAVLAEAARRTGQLCALLADLFSPQVILLGSMAHYLGPWWTRHVQDEFRREALPANSRHTRILPAGLGDRLQDLSALAPCLYRKS